MNEEKPHRFQGQEFGFIDNVAPERDSEAALLYALLAGGGGLALYNNRGNKRKNEKRGAAWDTFKSHLPSIRLPDTIAGAALGGAGGWLADSFIDKDTKESKEESRKKKINRILGGMALGAGAGNLVGDRFRRYVSNTVEPMGYSDKSIKPRSWEHFRDAAILDKPYQGELTHNQTAWDAPDSTARLRYEAFRRALGVHNSNPDTDLWAENPDKSLSLNPKHPKIDNLVQDLLIKNREETVQSQDPVRLAAFINSSDKSTLTERVPGHPDSIYNPFQSLMSEVTGGQRINVEPGMLDYSKQSLAGAAKWYLNHIEEIKKESNVEELPAGFPDLNAGLSEVKNKGWLLKTPSSYTLKSRDRWDVGPSNEEMGWLKKIPSEVKNNGVSWLNSPVDKDAPIGYSDGKTNKTEAIKLLQRLATEKLLFKQAPWISHNVVYDQQDENGNWRVTPYTGGGTPYR
jgi:hypothetical protein